MIRSSFASFTTARLAIQANQSAMSVIGQNMANAKTPGYTRQRLDQVSINLKGISSMYGQIPDAHIGSGVMVTGVSQIRDPYLDNRYRMEMGSLGSIDKRVDILDKLGNIFDETGRSALDDQFSDFSSQLSAMMKDSSSNSNDSMVRSSAQTIASMFLQYSKQINDVKTDLETTTERDAIAINNILTEIRELNKSIKSSQVHGNPALELQDDRNLLLDELSTYANIKISYKTDLTSGGAKVEMLSVDMLTDSASGSTVINLIDDINEPAQFSFVRPEPGFDQYTMSVTDSRGTKFDNIVSDKGTFEAALSMLNHSGEFDTPPSTTRGIGYYQGVLDNLANTFATKMNELNTVKFPQADGTTMILGGPLFATTDGSSFIDASNITISKEWQNGTVKILPSQELEAASKDNTNILNMVNAMKNPQTFKTPSGTTSFSGSFQECFTHMVDVQAMDQKSNTTILDNYLAMSKETSNSKDSVSGVSMDEEGMNLLQYNSSLTAASRLMTTLDEALNTIINNMGVVGR